MFEGRYAMYLNFEVDIPKIPGKINYVKKGVQYTSDMCSKEYIIQMNILVR